MNARERQIKELLSRPNCPECGRPSPLGEHDCDAPYTVADARARIDVQQAQTVLDAINDRVCAAGDSRADIGAIGMNERTRRRITGQLRRGSGVMPGAMMPPVTQIAGIDVIEDPAMPDDVLSFIGKSRAAFIKDLLDSVTDPVLQRGPAKIAIDGKPLAADIKSVAVNYDLLGRSARGATDQLDAYRWMFAAPLTDPQIGRITGLTS